MARARRMFAVVLLLGASGMLGAQAATSRKAPEPVKPNVECGRMAGRMIPASWTKVILNSAAADFQSHAPLQMRWYDLAVKHSGQAAIDKSVRFFVTPNASHAGFRNYGDVPTRYHGGHGGSNLLNTGFFLRVLCVLRGEALVLQRAF